MSFPWPITGPIAPEINPLIEPGYYNPSRFVISGITKGQLTTVTTSINHNYVIGQEVRLLVPIFYGMFQIDELSGFVQSIPAANQVVVNINSTDFNNFIPSPSFGPTLPQIIPLGNVNNGGINSSGLINQATTIPGAFINVSPTAS